MSSDPIVFLSATAGQIRKTPFASGNARWRTSVAPVLVSATPFGLTHTEQGFAGVGLASLGALFLSSLLIRYETLWEPVLTHGFSNAIGLVALYLVGPIYVLW